MELQGFAKPILFDFIIFVRMKSVIRGREGSFQFSV